MTRKMCRLLLMCGAAGAVGVSSACDQMQREGGEAARRRADEIAQTRETPAGPAMDPTGEWRPAWWHEQPVLEAGLLSACAMAEDANLRLARKRAIERAIVAMGQATGGAPTPQEVTTQADSVRLGDGKFRTFVRMTTGR